MTDFLNATLQTVDPNAKQKVPTRGERAKETADAIRATATQTTVQFINGLNSGFDLVWAHPAGLSPQEVCDALGTDASAVFDHHRQACEFLAGHAPASLPLLRQVPAGYEITYETDAAGQKSGRVTVTELPTV